MDPNKIFGARVTVELDDGTTQTDEVRAGGGYLSQSTSDLFFGLPSERKLANVRVVWPNGRMSQHEPTADTLTLTLHYTAP